MKRLSLNSEGAFLTMMQSRIPQSRIISSTKIEHLKQRNMFLPLDLSLMSVVYFTLSGLKSSVPCRSHCMQSKLQKIFHKEKFSESC